MASSLSGSFQNVGVVNVTGYNGAEGDHFLVNLPLEIPLEGIEVNPGSNMDLLMFSETDDIVPQPVEVVIDGSGFELNSLDYAVDQENIAESEIYLHNSPLDHIIEAEVHSEQSPFFSSRRGRGGRKNGSRTKCKQENVSGDESQRNSSVNYLNNDYALYSWSSAEVKQEPLVDEVEEEVTTYSFASSSNDFDSMNWPKSSVDSLSGIDLDELRQLSDYVKPKTNKFAVDPDKTVPCSHPGCSKTFKDNTTMRKHLHTHGPKSFVCSQCEKSFVESSKLKRHYLVHTGEKSFKCMYEGCNKRFSLDFNLKTHQRIHTGERPYPCPYKGCTKSFAQSTNLKSHLQTHGKQKSPRPVQYEFDDNSSWLHGYDD